MEKTVEQAIEDLSADVTAMMTLQAFMIADLASRSDDPLETLHSYSDNVSSFIIDALPLKDVPNADAVRARMLKTVQGTLDSVARIVAKAVGDGSEQS